MNRGVAPVEAEDPEVAPMIARSVLEMKTLTATYTRGQISNLSPNPIKAIKVRPTHSNMIFPGPGIGGYCLPKDGGLGVWSYKGLGRGGI